jgi:hypothetical protein
MNSIIDVLMNSAGGGAVNQVGQKFGLSQEQTSSALGELVPALMAGLQRNSAQEGGMEGLLGALSSGNHARYLEDPGLLEQETTRQDGNSILGHIFGSKDVSRAVAGRAAEQTGIGADVLKQMLPVVATMVMGGLSRQTATAAAVGQGTGSAGFLSSLLDQNRNGSVADEVVGLLGRFLGGR